MHSQTCIAKNETLASLCMVDGAGCIGQTQKYQHCHERVKAACEEPYGMLLQQTISRTEEQMGDHARLETFTTAARSILKPTLLKVIDCDQWLQQCTQRQHSTLTRRLRTIPSTTSTVSSNIWTLTQTPHRCCTTGRPTYQGVRKHECTTLKKALRSELVICMYCCHC